MKHITFIKGATACEMQIGRIWIAIRFITYWRSSGIGFIRITTNEQI